MQDRLDGVIYEVRSKAVPDAQTDAIQAEDIANGVYIPAVDLPNQEPKRAGKDTLNI